MIMPQVKIAELDKLRKDNRRLKERLNEPIKYMRPSEEISRLLSLIEENHGRVALERILLQLKTRPYSMTSPFNFAV